MKPVRVYLNNFTAGVLSPAIYARVDLSKYASGCKRILNGVVHAHGGISKRPGTRYVDTVSAAGLLIPFTYSVTQTYILAFFDKSMRIYKDGGVICDPDTNAIVEIETPYSLDELADIRYTQSADTMFLAHPSHKPTTLTRSSHYTWTFSVMAFTPSISAPTGLSATATGFSGSNSETINYKVSAVNERECESLPSAAAAVGITTSWTEGAVVKLSWTAVSDAIRYEVYKNNNGWYCWIGSASGTAFTDNNIEGDDSSGPKENRTPFENTGDYPGAVGIYQQRLCFGRTDNDPQTVWASQTGAFDSMAVSNPLVADDAITATVDSRQMNEIRHFVPMKNMIILSSGAEIVMSPGMNSDAVSPTSIRFDLQSYWGSSKVPPIVTGNSVLIILNSGRIVRDLFYQTQDDGYTGTEVSILAENLIDSPIVSWAYQQSPFSTIWICLESGTLLTFTYMREQEIWAWSKHESSGGLFKSVAVIRENNKDVVYFLVQRGDSFVVEQQVVRDFGDKLEDSMFLDSGLEYEGSPATHITGLGHLAGQTIAALADGSVVRNIKVASDGSFDMPVAAAKIKAGLPYTLTIENLDPEIRASDGGPSEGLKKNVTKVYVHVRESLGLSIGPDESHLIQAKYPVPASYGAPPSLYSGVLVDNIPGLHRREATVVIRHDDPVPLTILSLMEELTLE